MLLTEKWLCITENYPWPSFDSKLNGGEKMKKNTVRVYDTVSKKYVDVEVSEEVRVHYNRTQWNIDDNNKSFYNHEIQFSALIGGKDGTFENFREFINEHEDVEEKAVYKVLIERLYDCLIFLPESDRELIEMLYFEGMTERECAEFYGISQKNINKKKAKILCKLNKLLEK